LSVGFQRDPTLKDTVLIAVSGYGTAADGVRTKETGLHRHSVKPVDPVALQRLIVDLDRGLAPCLNALARSSAVHRDQVRCA